MQATVPPSAVASSQELVLLELRLGELRHARIALTRGFLLPVQSARVKKHYAGR